jgi:hypothetical protein
MKFCMPHWEALRTAVNARGLGDLVARSGEELGAKLEKELAGDNTLASFDPLMAAHNMILSNALNAGGLEVMAPNDDGTERCPVCYLSVPDWIDKAADGVKKFYDEELSRQNQQNPPDADIVP